MTPAEICERVDFCKMSRSNVEAIWNVVERYIMPLRIGDMYSKTTSETQLELFRDDVYDSTGILAAQKMAASMHGSITNPLVQWATYKFRLKELLDDPECAAWLQRCTEIVFDELYQANFDPEISAAYQDLVGPGNAIMTAEAVKEDPNDWRGLAFCCVPLKEAFFERDYQGNVYRFYRLLNWSATEIKSKWPEPDQLPAEVVKAVEAAKPDDRFEIVYAIYTREKKYQNRGKYPLGPLERPIGCQYVFKASRLTIDKEDGYYEMPAYHCPWEKTSGSIWGHGPGMVMAPTVQYINSWMEMEDLALRKMIEPSSLVQERGLMSDLDLAPGGMTVVRDIERSIKPFQADGRIDLSEQKVQDLRMMVREAFHNDELQLKESPQMSATEAQIRYELMNRVLGPTLARIQTNILDPLMDRVFKILLRNGRFPPVPAMVKDKQAQLKVDYSGPLMRSQRSDEVAAIERFVGQVGGMAKVFPAALNVLDPVKVVRELAKRMGVPMSMLRSETEVARMVEAQQKAQAMQARSQLQQQSGEAMTAQATGQRDMQQLDGEQAAA
jgi:hypothetical protein